LNEGISFLKAAARLVGAIRQNANKAPQSKRDFFSRQVKLEIKCYSYKRKKLLFSSVRTMKKKKFNESHFLFSAE